KLGAELFLHQLINDAFRQVIACGFKLVQYQSPTDQLLELSAAQFIQLVLEHLGSVEKEAVGTVGNREIDFIGRNHRVMDDCADAVRRVGADLGQWTRNHCRGQDERQKSHLN